MFTQKLQLVCSVLAFSVVTSVFAQASTTGTENGIVSAAGSPATSQSVSYSIMGGDVVTPTSMASAAATQTVTPTSTSANDATVVSGTTPKLTDSNSHGLSTPAILGITVAVILAVVGIVILAIVTHRRRRQEVARAKRKSIMDVEFAASHATLRHVDMINTEKPSNIGYFDIAKPLPAVIHNESPVRPERRIEDDRLSRSSTIIADAAEIAQINRKASTHQRKGKKSREQQRERNHALRILITNENNRTSVLHQSPQSPLASNPTTPVDAEPTSPRECLDGNGDSFAKRPSKI